MARITGIVGLGLLRKPAPLAEPGQQARINPGLTERSRSPRRCRAHQLPTGRIAAASSETSGEAGVARVVIGPGVPRGPRERSYRKAGRVPGRKREPIQVTSRSSAPSLKCRPAHEQPGAVPAACKSCVKVGAFLGRTGRAEARCCRSPCASAQGLVPQGIAGPNPAPGGGPPPVPPGWGGGGDGPWNSRVHEEPPDRAHMAADIRGWLSLVRRDTQAQRDPSLVLPVSCAT